MDSLTPEVERMFAAKEERRRKLAALPFPEKVRILVRLQEMAMPLLRGRNSRACVWKIDAAPPSTAGRRCRGRR